MKKKTIDLRKPRFKNGDTLTAKSLNDLWKRVVKLTRKVEKLNEKFS